LIEQMDYGPFSKIYNKYWGPQLAEINFNRLGRYLLPHLPEIAEILDLCCGTGQLSKKLTDHGHLVTGIDSSAAMLEFATENAPLADFIKDDARNFVLEKRFDAVIATSDSLNHILSSNELSAVFSCAYKALKKNGLFYFDLNSEIKYQTLLPPSSSIVEDDQVCIVRAIYNPDTRTARFEPTIFYFENGWQRADITLWQVPHNDMDVIEKLQTKGFSEIKTFDLEIEPEEKDPDCRIAYICRKI